MFNVRCFSDGNKTMHTTRKAITWLNECCFGRYILHTLDALSAVGRLSLILFVLHFDLLPECLFETKKLSLYAASINMWIPNRQQNNLCNTGMYTHARCALSSKPSQSRKKKVNVILMANANGIPVFTGCIFIAVDLIYWYVVSGGEHPNKTEHHIFFSSSSHRFVWIAFCIWIVLQYEMHFEIEIEN